MFEKIMKIIDMILSKMFPASKGDENKNTKMVDGAMNTNKIEPHKDKEDF